MRSKIMKCPACCRYTLKSVCSVCGGPTITTKPARFSPVDHYGKYRRALNQEGTAK
ncbi:MAG: RNA-protein complex protein Nop10 [Methanotrichaceae archaeon]